MGTWYARRQTGTGGLYFANKVYLINVMKYFLVILTLIVLSLQLRAQQPGAQKEENAVYAAVEHEPSFPGGPAKFAQFLKDNIKSTGDKGRIFDTFVVENDGSLSDIKVLHP